MSAVLVKCEEDEFIENLQKLWPNTVYTSQRTLWLYMGNRSHRSSGIEGYLFHHFKGNEVWATGLREALDKHSKSKGLVSRAIHGIKIAGDTYEPGSDIYYFTAYSNMLESNFHVPVLQATY